MAFCKSRRKTRIKKQNESMGVLYPKSKDMYKMNSLEKTWVRSTGSLLCYVGNPETSTFFDSGWAWELWLDNTCAYPSIICYLIDCRCCHWTSKLGHV